MRNKGFFWFLTALLTAVCLYQLSFTWVSNNVETKAGKEADGLVADLLDNAEKTGDSVVYLPNNTRLNLNELSTSEVEELAKAAYVNDILREKAESSVYPVFGSSFKEVKKRSLAFGLDLVGGMSITMEVSVPDLVKGYIRNQRDRKFKKIYDGAMTNYNKDGGDFITLFMESADKNGASEDLVELFAISEIDELGMNSSNDDVEDFLRSRESSAMDGICLLYTSPSPRDA